MHGKFPGMEHRSCCVPSSSQKKHGEIQFVRIDRQKAYHDGIPKKNQKRLSFSLRIQSPCQMMIGVYNYLLSKVFRFHYHSHKVIGLVGSQDEP